MYSPSCCIHHSHHTHSHHTHPQLGLVDRGACSQLPSSLYILCIPSSTQTPRWPLWLSQAKLKTRASVLPLGKRSTPSLTGCHRTHQQEEENLLGARPTPLSTLSRHEDVVGFANPRPLSRAVNLVPQRERFRFPSYSRRAEPKWSRCRFFVFLVFPPLDERVGPPSHGPG